MTIRALLRRITGQQWAMVASVLIVAGFCWLTGEAPFQWLVWGVM